MKLFKLFKKQFYWFILRLTFN